MDTISFANDFWVNFLANLSAGLAALLLGIPFGLWLDRLVQSRNKKDLRAVLFHALKDETIYNIRQLMNILVSIPPDGKGVTMPGYYLSTCAWEAIINGGQVEILDNKEVLRISLYNYRLIERIHINIKRLEASFLMSTADNNQNSIILKKMIASSAREGLDVGVELLKCLDKTLKQSVTEINGLDELMAQWDANLRK